MGLEAKEVTWTEDLECGVDVLDDQHRRYFDLLNAYLTKSFEMKNQTARTFDLVEQLAFLRQYAAEHFSTEEEVMQQAGYPEFDAHYQEHQYFLKHVDALYQRMRHQGYTDDLAREVNYYTAEWFIEHIRVTDMQVVEFLKQKSRTGSKLSPYLKRMHHALFKKHRFDPRKQG